MARLCRALCLVLSAAALVSASSILPRHADEESLKSALDAVTRKQRSLDLSHHDYYSDLENFKYRPNEPGNEDPFGRQQDQDSADDEDEALEFLPIENGQLENIGGGYQNFNSKRLERALLDYLENSPAQRETVSSSFRERERTSGHKRALPGEHGGSSGEPDKELAELLYKELEKGPMYGGGGSGGVTGMGENQDYLLWDALRSNYDRYVGEQAKSGRNKPWDTSSDAMTWGEIFSKQESSKGRGNKKILRDEGSDEEGEESMANSDFGNRERDQDWAYLLPTERRNVNGRYPIGREYGVLLKRYPLTKRSPKPLHHEKEPTGVITDPKVAKDLGPLFGAQKTVGSKDNRTDDKKVLSSDEEKRDRDHENDDKGHEHEHDSPSTPATESVHKTPSTEGPKSLINSPKVPPGQKEITNPNSRSHAPTKLLNKRDHRDHLELAKKNIDWSDYFGIDRRKKKSALLARPGSQDQDDEWMLQRYYKTMAENLKSAEEDAHPDKDNDEKRDKLDQMDDRLKNVKNLIVEDALKYGREGNSQEADAVVMTRLAAAYSLEKMRKALEEFRTNIAAQRDLMRAAHAKNNETHHSRDRNDDKNGSDYLKRSGHGIVDDDANYGGRNIEGFDEGRGCPVLDAMVHRCPRPGLGGKLNGIHELCIMHQMCHACDNEEEDCSRMFALGAEKICEAAEDPRNCLHIVSYWAIQPSPMAIASCHAGPESCLRRSYRYRHRGIYYQNGWLPYVPLDVSQLGER
ncbi:uncharacterized protein [Venturia canescens]|uniref:uncharacterized protein n=1 Tax=Venturia canescens TaxID=32260 RepID=UPI001C9D0D47|nr:uncharacterized protein LOC122415540 [Venturia canescens]